MGKNMNTNDYIWSDLACEMLPQEALEDETRMRSVGDIRILRLHVTPEQESCIRRPSGIYVTLKCGRIDRLEREGRMRLFRILAGEISGLAERLVGRRVGSTESVLVVGLGNAELTADALGPLAAASIAATRHLKEWEEEIFSEMGCAAISVLTPGVVGKTGMETAETIGAAVSQIKPDIVLVADALAARDVSHLASTIQISTGGISPGSGVGNHRAAITQKTLGVPVLVMGVPTVVSSSALVYSVLECAGIGADTPEIEKVLERGRSFFVSPKESDLISRRAAEIFSEAVMLAFGGAFREIAE